MTTARRAEWEYPVCVEWQGKVSEAARPFEGRWTEGALRRIDPALHARFKQQQELFNASLAHGSTREVGNRGAAMVRGYVAVVTAMQAAGVPDDAYQIGCEPKSGLTVAVGPKPCCDRLQELYGDSVQWFSPDEIATIIAMDARFKQLADVKRVFPGAEIVNNDPRVNAGSEPSAEVD
jgi:hypothetical protein